MIDERNFESSKEQFLTHHTRKFSRKMSHKERNKI